MSLFLIILGFGFVIFWHELGHFLAARWAGVRVEQFAVGMGQAVVSWRKGIGLRWMRWAPKRGFVWGSTQKEFDERVEAELARRRNEDVAFKDMFEPTFAQRYEIARELGIGETEYRLSWIPIGGYVKPTGQDDLRPQKEVGSDDPRSYASKSVGKRMVIISAGVVMNVILAGILFPILFMYGFTAPTPVIGYVAPNSPAQQAGLQVGDRFETIEGHRIHDFTKVPFNVALLPRDRPAEIQVVRDGQLIEKTVQQVWNPKVGSLQIGVGGFSVLTRADTPKAREFEKLLPTDPTRQIEIGETIIAANGESLGLLDYPKLWSIIQKSGGQPVTLTLQRQDGSTRELVSTPEYQPWFLDELNFIGLQPRTVVSTQWTPAADFKLDMKPGDVVASIQRADAAAPTPFPALEEFVDVIGK
ncbi:MAG TPA: site-2 protease family protein, partial [Tepidisphaeraceae bacterium]|nr:site-2 protease family protein [Tepidisphaeraceae bacterium]